MLDVARLTETELAQLKARLTQMGMADVSGRTPEFRERQLHDLTLAPRGDDPRPLFVWSAESPRGFPVGPPTPYPKLLWHGETDQEITVRSKEEDVAKQAQGYVDTPPLQRVLSEEEEVALAFASLSPEDRTLLLEETAKAKRAALQDKLAHLSDAALERLVNAASTPKAKKRA